MKEKEKESSRLGEKKIRLGNVIDEERRKRGMKENNEY